MTIIVNIILVIGVIHKVTMDPISTVDPTKKPNQYIEKGNTSKNPNAHTCHKKK